MKNPSPKEIALISSGVLTGFLFVSLLLAWKLAILNTSWYVVLGFVVVVFGLSYWMFSYFLRQFIYRKIKLIYKHIHDLKAPKGAKPLQIDLGEDIITDVEQEVYDWATDKTQEIETLRNMETYRKEFLGNVSHELKTPIFNAQGYLHTLIDGGLKDERINKSYLYKASKNLDRLNHIVEDLEVIAKYESNTLHLDITKFNITELIEEVIESLEMQADLKDIKLALKPNTNKAVSVLADRERIRQVLVNLTTNSIKYGNDSGKTTYGIFDMDQNILIEVTDTGLGIEQEHLPRLFERFYRVDKSRAREMGGTGLGLAIVKHIVEAHHQTINVRSTVGLGSTFGFTIKKA